ncbi:MAG: hypothetical protein JWM47_4062 [Acidimicrobiales bacterium]|nr:hypothetical protein [Acidimicrobiales bacterium]
MLVPGAPRGFSPVDSRCLSRICQPPGVSGEAPRLTAGLSLIIDGPNAITATMGDLQPHVGGVVPDKLIPRTGLWVYTIHDDLLELEDRIPARPSPPRGASSKPVPQRST